MNGIENVTKPPDVIAAPADWSDMAIFLAVLDAGSLIAAAELLNLSQPTVGRRLSALEERIGVQLFARAGRRMVPTEVAHRIEESARKMSREMHAIQRGIAGASKGLHGQVTISANEGTGTEWLIPVIASLQRKYPDILIELKIEARAANLVQREADIALRMGRPTQLDLITRKLATVGFGFYASDDWLARNGPVSEIRDLSGLAWVRGAFAKGHKDALGSFFEEHQLEPNIAVSTNSPAAQLIAVREGMGVGVISHRWASRIPGLQRLIPDFDATTIDLWLVTHEDLRYSARIRAVADHIADAARTDAANFERGERPGKQVKK
ncbi:MAG: LysR family transcriptional regulator [Congregibacter sp.]